MEAKQATMHHELIAQLLDSRIPKTEREHAAAREIERLRAALLQELIEAPESEPVARVTGYYGGYLSIVTVDGQVLHAGTALYAAPPHQSEHHLEMVNTPAPSVPVKPMENIALNEWLDKTEWVQKELNTFPVSSLGMHRADVMRLEIDRLRKLLSAAPTPAEPPADLDAPEFSDGCEKEGFPGGCERMGCCKQLPATANPARTSSSQIEPPADLVRDAEPWKLLLENLVEGLNKTYWSSWQGTAHFDEYLREAISAIERDKLKGQS